MIPAGFEPVLRELLPVRDRFAAAGHRLFLVGGTVRDLMVGGGRTDFDLDATTPARPAQVKAILQGWADALWTQGERFGTIGAMKRVVDPDTGESFERIYEITTHRAESYEGHTRKPVVEFADDIVADLSRRDFTVNAMAIELTTDEPHLVDPFDGAADLAAGVLRTPLEPHVSFSDDPLRMLRAARFIARYELTPTADLVAAVTEMAGRLAIVSAERVHDETFKLLAAPDPTAGLLFVFESGIGHQVAPHLAGLDAGVRTRTMQLVRALPADQPHLRMAGLLSASGRRAALAQLREWRSSNADVEAVGSLIERLDGLQPVLDSDDPFTDAAVRRIVHGAAGHLAGVLSLARADALIAGRTHRLTRLDILTERVADLGSREPLDDLAPELDGDAVMSLLGLAPGREVGAALQHLQQLRLDEGLMGAEAAASRLQRWWFGRV